jgi:LysM repeat protein
MSRAWLAIRIWFFLGVFAVSLISIPAFAQGATAVVRTDPATASVKVNDSFTVLVKAENIANLTAIELHLSFNPAVLEVTSLINGGFVVADFTAQNTYDNNAGTIDYAIAQMNRAPALGNGTLLGINFRAKANGASTIAVRPTQAAPGGILLSDKDGKAIQASWAGANITVGTPTQVTVTATTPAPTTAVPPTTVPPTSTSATPTVTPAPGVLGTHTVLWSETLYCIGRAYKISPWAIADKNGIRWPYIITPGQKLSIPNTPWIPVPAGRVCPAQFTMPISTPSPTPIATVATTPPPAVTVTPTPAPICRATYIVKYGDTLYHIATGYGIKYEDLARVNNISSPWIIYAGQSLCIP